MPEPTNGINFKLLNIVCILLEVVVSNFQLFLMICVKMVTTLVNVVFRTFFDIFLLIIQKTIAIFGILFVSCGRALKFGLEP